MSEKADNFEPPRLPEERFQPKTPREERLFEQAKRQWYADVWEDITKDWGKDPALAAADKKFQEAVERREVLVPENLVSSPKNIVERGQQDEWLKQNIAKFIEEEPDIYRFLVRALSFYTEELVKILALLDKTSQATKLTEVFVATSKHVRSQEQIGPIILAEALVKIRDNLIKNGMKLELLTLDNLISKGQQIEEQEKRK